MKKTILVSLILIFALFRFNVSAQTSAETVPNNTTKSIASTKNYQLQLHKVTEMPQGMGLSHNNSILISKDEQRAFLSTNKGTVLAYDLATGDMLSKLNTGNKTGQITLFDNGKKRLLAVVNLNNPSAGDFATVSILDASGERLVLQAAFMLPPQTLVAGTMSAAFDKSGERVIIASENPGQIFVFSTQTGKLLDQMPLTDNISSLTIVNQSQFSVIGAVSTNGNRIINLTLSSTNKLIKQSVFEIPQGDHLTTDNNLCFNKTGTIGYIATVIGNELLSFNTFTGQLIEQFQVGDSPARLSISTYQNQTRLAVVNTGLNKEFLADSVLIVDISSTGLFGNATVFLPPPGTDLVSSSTLKLSRDIGLVGALKDSIFMFDPETGKQITMAKVLGTATRFAFSSTKLVSLTTSVGAPAKHLAIFNLINNSAPVNSLPLVNTSTSTHLTTKESNSDSSSANSSIALKIYKVRAYPIRRGLKLAIEGEGFQEGVQVSVNSQALPTSRHNTHCLSTKLSWQFVGTRRQLSVSAQNPTGLPATKLKRIRRR